MRTPSRFRGLVAAAAVAAACGGTPPAAIPQSPPFTLSESARLEGWRVLFGGSDLAAWRGFRRVEVPTSWSIESGALYCAGRLGAPDLVTRETFADFELVLEFRTDAPDHNSGILYRVTEEHGQTYHSGPEFQILDGARRAVQRTGANYALHAPERDAFRPSGEWNEARIVVRGASVEHWLNGERVVAYDLWSPDWEARVADSKFARWPDYGRAREGHVALQSHGDPVWFRNIRIRRLAR